MKYLLDHTTFFSGFSTDYFNVKIFLRKAVTLVWAFVIRMRNSTETLDFNCY